jgi:signal transduction histidine kinase
MKRSWQVWLLYAVCLAVALPALVWLTVAALGAEQAENAARVNAEREKQLRLATWRIDTLLMPILTPESARSYDDYPRHLSKDGSWELGWPTTPPASKYVAGFFEVAPNGAIYSYPARAQRDPERLAKLKDGEPKLEFNKLAFLCSTETLLDDRPDSAANLAALDRAAKRTPNDAANQQAQAALDDDYLRRQEYSVKNTVRELIQQRSGKELLEQDAEILEGVSRTVWLGDDLLVVRRVLVDGKERVVGCRLDWDLLRHDMQAEVADLLPGVELKPVRGAAEVNYAHALATLPVELAAPPAVVERAGLTPLRVGLSAAWIGLVVAALAAAVLLAGVVALSQRREAFVSAVTHELRTPLTTFRMYCEMLDGGMVADANQQKEYLRTLRVEADRLRHLVENVLAYAGLERGRRPAQRERLTLADLWTRVESRLTDRAREAGMEIVREMDEAAAATEFGTDASAVEQILFNLVDNACKYAASAIDRTIHLKTEVDKRQVRFCVRDHGSGVAAAETRRLFRPFSKTAEAAASSAPGVGLGLALCRRLARQMGGDLQLVDTDGGGATFVLTLPRT